MPDRSDHLRYLQKIGHSWYARIRVPPSLVGKVGQTHLRQALGTRDLTEANARKWAVVEALKARLHRYKTGSAPARAPRMLEQAAELRAQLRAIDEEDPTGQNRTAIEGFLLDRAEEVAGTEPASAATAAAWYRAATASATDRLCSELLDEYLDVGDRTEATKNRARRAWEEVAEFMGSDPRPAEVTDDAALRYLDKLRASDRGIETVRGRVVALSAFWSWMQSRRLVPKGTNPWAGHQLRLPSGKAKSGSRPERRPYTDAELVALLTGNVKVNGRRTAGYLRDLAPLLLTTGLRINEACSLLVRDVELERGHAMLTVTEGKTAAARRRVAVVRRSVLAMLRQRVKGRAPDAQVFHELEPGGPDNKLSWSAVKAFTRYRRDCGIPDGPDAHSLRRAFMAAMEAAGVPPVVAQRVVGHEVPTIMHTVYTTKASDEQIVTACKAARFPKAVEALL